MCQEIQLENGLTLLLEHVPNSKLFAAELFVPCGALTEPILGNSSLLEEWLRRGAGGRNAKAFEDAWDSLGIVRGSEVGLEGMEFSLTCLCADTSKALELLAEWVLAPNLEEGEFLPSLEAAKAALIGLEDAPDELLYAKLWDAAFASSHKRSPYGKLEGFLQLNPALVRRDHIKRCSPQGAILACCGAIDWTDLLEFAKQWFGGWSGTAQPTPAVVWRTPKPQFEPRDTAQTQIGMIMPMVEFGQPGYYESRFALEVLGGGNSSRLFNEVREKRGLVYGIHAGNSFVRGAGTLEVFASCTPNHTKETLEVIAQELERWCDGIEHDEFIRARIGIQTGLAISLESVGARAAALMRDTLLLGRPRSFEEVRSRLAAVKLEDVNAWLAGLDLRQLHTYVLGVEVQI